VLYYFDYMLDYCRHDVILSWFSRLCVCDLQDYRRPASHERGTCCNWADVAVDVIVSAGVDASLSCPVTNFALHNAFCVFHFQFCCTNIPPRQFQDLKFLLFGTAPLIFALVFAFHWQLLYLIVNIAIALLPHVFAVWLMFHASDIWIVACYAYLLLILVLCGFYVPFLMKE